jgi:hypothetical protein
VPRFYDSIFRPQLDSQARWDLSLLFERNMKQRWKLRKGPNRESRYFGIRPPLGTPIASYR